ncbi:ABC transporter permease [Catalinimonas niigatensis]|uniref:ABC transporter permease n=1 Tax=Catalinimonas niigatensis TaxID=1397264 RepID=UPI0026664EF6|nr:ABC transporter permease [Catalinimonas niigatensis]WPP49621.1 ABC transporter permease [Catalinimonas niigatensis]
MCKLPKHQPEPPKLATRFLRWYCRAELVDEVEGDLYELFQRRVDDQGLWKAETLYWLNVLMFLHPDYIRKRNHYPTNHTAMLKSYFTIAFRNLTKRKLYAGINILGLSIGLTSCLLIFLYIHHELSYDTMHTKADRIYRVAMKWNVADQQIDATLTPPPLAETAVEEFPEVVNAARICHFLSTMNIRYGETAIIEEQVLLADSTFFDVFSFPLVAGDPATALVKPNTAVITETTARKYFGNVPALGKTLLVGDGQVPHEVTGVVKDLPANVHFHFSMLRSMASLEFASSDDWFEHGFITYLLLREGASSQSLEAKFSGLVEKYVGPVIPQYFGVSLETFIQQGNQYGYFLQPLLDIHLHSNLDQELEPNGDITYVYVLAIIAFFIILLACINFMNLATARSANRAKEVGVRKTLGSLRSSLVGQFMTESVVLSFIATCLAVLGTNLLLPSFGNIAGKEISGELFVQSWFLLGLLGFTLLVGILAGSYPAFYLSSFGPVEVLKGKLTRGTKSRGIRNILVVFQFFASITLVICTLLVYQQLEYAQAKNLGLDKENVMIMKGAQSLSESQQAAFKQDLINQSQVVNASISYDIPPGSMARTIFKKNTAEKGGTLHVYEVDYDFLATMQIELLEGRNFSRSFSTDTAAILLNESAVKKLGPGNLLNEEIVHTGSGKTYQVVGIVKDFNYESLRHEIQPMALMLTNQGTYLSARINSDDVSATVAQIESLWEKHAPAQPFQYTFMDDNYEALFRAEQRLGKVFSIFTGLAIVVACLGLLGLATFMAEQRTKEIGIRKVMGASATNIIILLSGDFTKLVILAFVIAIPVAYYLMQWWLEGFAYRTNISLWVFVLAGVGALLIAWLTVSWQSIKAALANPIDSLKTE